jgi:TetR/AcrR family transcriptional repressor of nem operon
MGKVSNRQRILTEGLRVVHEQGFAGASVRDIVGAAGVPQGSFTNHFVSKEAFGLEVLNLYYDDVKARMDQALQDAALAPLARLHNWIAAVAFAVEHKDLKAGCMFGNFSAESTSCDGVIRHRLADILTEMQSKISACLRAAVEAEELPRRFAVEQTAGFILSSLQGAILLSKAHRNIAPIEQFEQILFEKVLR